MWSRHLDELRIFFSEFDALRVKRGDEDNVAPDDGVGPTDVIRGERTYDEVQVRDNACCDTSALVLHIVNVDVYVRTIISEVPCRE